MVEKPRATWPDKVPDIDVARTMRQLYDLYNELHNWGPYEFACVEFCICIHLAPWLPFNRNNPWGGLSGSASTGKSTILDSFKDLPYSVYRDDLTARSVTSMHQSDEDRKETAKTGKKKDKSLLHDLSYSTPPIGHKALYIPEFSTIMTSKGEFYNNWFAILRKAYDGDVGSHSGTEGGVVRKTDRLSLTIGGTPTMYDFFRNNATLGERLVIITLNRGPITLESILQSTEAEPSPRRKQELLSHIRNCTTALVANVIKRVQDWDKERCDVSPELWETFKKIAALCCVLRSSPLRSKMTDGEGPHRVRDQLALFGDTRALLYGRDHWIPEDLYLIRRVAQGCVVPSNLDVITALYQGDPLKAAQHGLTSEQAFDLAGIGTSPEIRDILRNQLDQWVHLRVLRRDRNFYLMEPTAAQTIHETQFLEGVI